MTTPKLKVHFLAGTVPAVQLTAIVNTLNWASDAGFKIEQAINVMLVSNKRVIGQAAPAGPQMESMVFFYCSCTEKQFQDYFGEPYSDEKLTEYPKMIGVIEDKKTQPDNVGA